VNQVEGPFSRSLVICDVFLRRDTYTGSRWCGSRLAVIQEGVEIQSRGQSQENLAMLLSLTFVVVLTGVLGAKVTLVLGLFAVTVSVLFFVIACASPKLGRSLYALAQGLQGVYPIEYLQGVIMFHLSWQPGVDSHAAFELGSYMGIVCNFVWNVGLGTIVSMLELNDYTAVWTGILWLNVIILVTAVFRFPEMMPPDAAGTEKGPFARLVQELCSYRDLCYDWRARRMMLKLFSENVQNPFFSVSWPAMMMAYHGWTQYQLVWFSSVKDVVGLACIPIYQRLLERYGHHRVYMWSVRWLELKVLLSAVTLPYTGKVAILLEVINTPLKGFEPFRGFVDSRFMEPEQVQRFQSSQWLMGYFQGVWLVPFYAYLFDAYAETYLQRFWPGLLCSIALVIHYFLVFYTIYDMDGIHGFGVTTKVLDEGSRKLNKLWKMVAGDDDCITYEKWQLYNLESILGLPWERTGGAGVFGIGHWVSLIETLNVTPLQGHAALKKLDQAIAYAHGVHEHFVRAATEQAEKAAVMWQMVSAGDGWISYEKWQFYKLDELLGLEWARTGGAGVFSKEQWLGLFDPWKASKEALKRLDYSIAHAAGLQSAIARMAEEAAMAQQGSAEAVERGAELQPSWEERGAWAEAQPAWEEGGAWAEAGPLPEAEVHSWSGHAAWEERAYSSAAHASVPEQDGVAWAEAQLPAEAAVDPAAPHDRSVADSADAAAGSADAAAGGAPPGPASTADWVAVTEAAAVAQAVASGAAGPSGEGKKDV